MKPDLSVSDDAEPVLEADLRSGVEAEEIGGEVAKVAIQRPREPVGDAKGAAVTRQTQRRGQANDRVVRLRRTDRRVGVGVGGGHERRRRIRRRLRGGRRRHDRCESQCCQQTTHTGLLETHWAHLTMRPTISG